MSLLCFDSLIFLPPTPPLVCPPGSLHACSGIEPATLRKARENHHTSTEEQSQEGSSSTDRDDLPHTPGRDWKYPFDQSYFEALPPMFSETHPGSLPFDVWPATASTPSADGADPTAAEAASEVSTVTEGAVRRMVIGGMNERKYECLIPLQPSPGDGPSVGLSNAQASSAQSSATLVTGTQLTVTADGTVRVTNPEHRLAEEVTLRNSRELVSPTSFPPLPKSSSPVPPASGASSAAAGKTAYPPLTDRTEMQKEIRRLEKSLQGLESKLRYGGRRPLLPNSPELAKKVGEQRVMVTQYLFNSTVSYLAGENLSSGTVVKTGEDLARQERLALIMERFGGHTLEISRRLAQSLKGRGCIVQNAGFWTYRVCPEAGEVHQLHWCVAPSPPHLPPPPPSSVLWSRVLFPSPMIIIVLSLPSWY